MRRLSIILIPVIAACSLNLFGPQLDFFNRRRMILIPPQYPEWYREAESCLGADGKYGRIRWFVADSIYVDGGTKAGVLKFPNDITMREDVANYSGSVKHEMVHHIVRRGDDLHDERGRVPCQ